MYKIDKETLQDIQSKYPYIKRHDINQTINDVHPNGMPTSIELHEGERETTSYHSLKRICYDAEGNIVDEEIRIDRGDNAIYDFDEVTLNTLQDEVELLQIRAYRFASEEQFYQIKMFRYYWLGLLDRIPPMLDVLPLLPTETTTDSDNMYYELRSKDQEKKFHKKYNELMDLAITLKEERGRPIGCPSLIKVKTWNKQIYLLVQKYKKKYWGKDWVDSELMNICKYLALRYKFKGEWKHPRNILNSFSQASHRTSLIKPSKVQE